MHQAKGCRDNTTGRKDGSNEYEVAVISITSLLLELLMLLPYSAPYSTSDYYYYFYYYYCYYYCHSEN